MKHKDYVLDRLIKGLASKMSASRLGFSTALSGFLHEHPDALNASEFLELIEEKLPLAVNKKVFTF